ncbi:putative bifunctional diguanylate cyclase/phosphodiesterase [Ruminococcus flavefaciens]|uniref:EAL domain, c-di-GMP-specific phosphodiesterase class I (Or its enzymatically inactive variant) n=1 Tax=Ruminococcus flavefaciens TaxID=1265 RepID=A0A1K1MM45_RUMFL|nr:bifunctional diguanylate cyclase/phosphodiesterase [Ruminococcus flavefaciens]SFW24171.1 EAL domain, c-di-GMP-specific phosphodiesterase class I (or its enzymatically inactive variant) [Ruminococcus flavefaciens]
MTNERTFEFYKLFEELIRSMTRGSTYDEDEILANVEKLAVFFRLTKATSEFYRTVADEKAGKGDIKVGYDNGKHGELFMSMRVVTKSMAVVKCNAYRAPDEVPMDDVEKDKLKIAMDSVLSFISRHRLEGVVEKFVFFDDTGYPNVRSFLRYLEILKKKNALAGCTAVYFNLRHLTLINRDIGRGAADIAIHNYFNMIKDIIGEKGIICRVGGDNFVGVFDDSLLNDVLGILSGTPVIYEPNSGKRIMLSANTGVFRMTQDFTFDAPGDVMDRILPALQAAKMGGKDSVVFYDDSMEVSREKRMEIQKLFPKALENKEFKVFYQPKIDIATGKLVGAEALCRWIRDGRIVPPMEFIPVLEQNTDICQLDFYMLDSVCADIRRWLDEGGNVVRISVNLSRKHMMDVDLLDHIMNIVDKHNVPHEYIEIELTETTTDVEFRDLKRVVSGLQQQGIYTSVDDFGMGYSSLNLLREIPWNVLKVDRCFLPVDSDDSTSSRTVMFKYVVAMAKELGLECIAEGVETQNQVKILRDNNCLYAQGFLFDKPLPLADFEERLKSGNYDVEA